MKALLDQENDMMQKMVTKIKASKADVVFCQKGIDDMVQHFLAKEGIMAARRVKESDMEKLARATGARISSDLDDLKARPRFGRFGGRTQNWRRQNDIC